MMFWINFPGDSMAVVELQLSKVMIEWIASSQGLSLEALGEQVMPKNSNKFLNGIVSKSGAEKLAKIGGVPLDSFSSTLRQNQKYLKFLIYDRH